MTRSCIQHPKDDDFIAVPYGLTQAIGRSSVFVATAVARRPCSVSTFPAWSGIRPDKVRRSLRDLARAGYVTANDSTPEAIYTATQKLLDFYPDGKHPEKVD